MTNPMSVDKEAIRKALDAKYLSLGQAEQFPNWLRSLLAENEQLEQRTLDKSNGWGECEEQNRQLREENEALRRSLTEEAIKNSKLALTETQNQQLREEQRILQIYFTREKDYRKEGQEIVTQLQEELEQVKKERDDLKQKWFQSNKNCRDRDDVIVPLRSELAAKDKALEEIANYPGNATGEDAREMRDRAISILSQYQKE